MRVCVCMCWAEGEGGEMGKSNQTQYKPNQLSKKKIMHWQI